jgi:hypothetical protein
MKQSGILSAAVLFLLFATASSASPQHEQPSKDEGRGQPGTGQQHQQARPTPQQHQQPNKPAQQRQQARPAPQQHQQAKKPTQRPERPQSPYGAAYHGGVRPNGGKFGGVHHSGVPQQQAQVHSGFQQSRARDWKNEHHTWSQRGGYNGYRVPEPRFRAYWGRPHPFRIYTLPLLFVGGYPRFRYDGYWITLLDPWPETWPANWYQTDDVYIDYTNDGYYLYDLTRPGPAIAVTVTF